MMWMCEQCQSFEATYVTVSSELWCERCVTRAGMQRVLRPTGPFFGLRAMMTWLHRLDPADPWDGLSLRDPRTRAWATKLGVDLPDAGPNQERDMAHYHEQHRDDPDEWEETAEVVMPRRTRHKEGE